MRRISTLQEDTLRAAFNAGEPAAAAARLAGVSVTAATDRFRKLGWDGKRRLSKDRSMYGLPKYSGPAWIGKAATGSKP